MRRTRRTAALRHLVAETGLSASDLIYPVFVLDGDDRTEQVESMPGVERQSVDRLIGTLGEAVHILEERTHQFVESPTPGCSGITAIHTS